MEDHMKNKISLPRYQQIAVEIASRIAEGQYQVSEKIYARSSLASQYGVSSETARRAICVLSDLHIVTAEKGSGVTIVSYERAVDFVKQYNKRQTIDMIKADMLESVARQKNEMENLNTHLSDLIAATEHFRSINPFMPFHIKITKDAAYLNYTIAELQFWQHTGATVIAIKKEDSIMISPGPYALLLEDDTLYFITQDDSPQRVKNYLYPPQE